MRRVKIQSLTDKRRPEEEQPAASQPWLVYSPPHTALKTNELRKSWYARMRTCESAQWWAHQQHIILTDVLSRHSRHQLNNIRHRCLNFKGQPEVPGSIPAPRTSKGSFSINKASCLSVIANVSSVGIDVTWVATWGFMLCVGNSFVAQSVTASTCGSPSTERWIDNTIDDINAPHYAMQVHRKESRCYKIYIK